MTAFKQTNHPAVSNNDINFNQSTKNNIIWLLHFQL